ncbi:MAG: aminopeptidase [Alphaproteobacteria bacterium]|nr:aminopeptidase [Alphaproteobacteria bacterium]
MFGAITRFELRYQLKNPVFWVVAILFFLLTFGAMTVDQIQIGSGGNVKKNAPFAIAQVHQILSLFFMFVTTAFVANVIVRDDESGFGPMVRATRVTKFDYLFGRFTGAALAGALAFAVVPLAIFIGSLMPWVDPETLGPNRLGDYAYAYGVLALPNVLLTAAIFFAVATVTRSMMYSYVGVVVFLVLYLVLNGFLRSKPELRELAALVEPFGLAAVGNATRYWTAAERNGLTPPITGALLANRAIWMGVALAALGFAGWRFRFADGGLSPKAAVRAAKKAAKAAALLPRLVDRLPMPDPRGAAIARLLARIRFEMGLVFKSPAYGVLLLIGLFNASGALIFANEIYGTPARPLTFALIEVLAGSFTIFPIIIAIYYAGEVVWRDRDRRFHEIVDSTSLPNWAYLVPKVLAVAGVLFTSLVVSVVAAMLVQLWRGVDALEPLNYLAWYILPSGISMVQLAALAVFVQALCPNKYVGWAVMLVYLVASITLATIGFEHPLYNFGATPPARFSDLNGNQIGALGGFWLNLYWSLVALVLAVLAHLLWRRGTDAALWPRLRALPRRLRGTPLLLLLAALGGAGASGAWIWHNTNVLNDYRTSDDNEARQAAYEKKYARYIPLKQPSTTDVQVRVDLFPEQRRMQAAGLMRLVNDTGAPLAQLHVRLASQRSELARLVVPGARLAMDDADNKYRIYRFDRPLAPGATLALDFAITREQRGFPARGEDINLIGNGSFLNNQEFLPQIGMSQDGFLADRAKRRKYGLPPEARLPKLDDPTAVDRNYLGNADWVSSDITVSTSAGQTPIAPGRKVMDRVAGGRRIARFVSPQPILSFFSVQSAAYAERSADADGVRLTVYHHPRHAYNVDRMLASMRTSLNYYRRNFGPYQFDHARIIEFPGYSSFAQAFAGTIPFSETIGFLAANDDPEKIDYVTYVTAHEVAHQYWGHQIISAEMQGGTLFVETMAQYSALMVMKQIYGEEKIRRFLKYELDNYLRSRGGEIIEELPLNRVENQPYIHYRKGSVVMYLLADRLGEARVNAMLAGILAAHKFKGQPYLTATTLVNGYKGLARTEEERQLVSDLFERITLYDLKARSASVKRLADGRWETRLVVDAAKLYADGKGVEKAAPLAASIDVGLFTARPGQGEFNRANVVQMQRMPIRSGTQTLVLIGKTRPTVAGIDPYNKYVDRNSDDNLVDIS